MNLTLICLQQLAVIIQTEHAINSSQTDLIDEFNDDELQNVTKRVYLVNAITQVVQCSILHQRNKLIVHRDVIFSQQFPYHEFNTALDTQQYVIRRRD